MEKSVEWGFDTYMQEIFQMKEVDIKEYSPLTLAYIGDCIYDLIMYRRRRTSRSQITDVRRDLKLCLDIYI